MKTNVKTSEKNRSTINVNNAIGGAANVMGSITNVFATGKYSVGVNYGIMSQVFSDTGNAKKRTRSGVTVVYPDDDSSEERPKKKAKIEVKSKQTTKGGNTTSVTVISNKTSGADEPVPRDVLERVVCSQCKDRLRTTIKPCGHSFYCNPCSVEYMKIKSGCPKCEGPVKEVVKIYP